LTTPNVHRLDLATLTAETAWRNYISAMNAAVKERNPSLRLEYACMASVCAKKHFERVDERMANKRPDMLSYNELDHSARGLRR
jgi:hypothetical protein